MGSFLNPDQQQIDLTTIGKKALPGNNSFLNYGHGTGSRIFKLTVILCIACLGLAVGLHRGHTSWFADGNGTISWVKPFVWMGSSFLSLVLAELAWRIILVIRYRPTPDCESAVLPRCTVVVPAFNEGVQVYKTLKCLAESDYPKEKLQLIAVDDGSQDDTWLWIKKAKQELGRSLTIIKMQQNKGKRHALYAGFQKSTGEILVTVDSDSMVEAKTLRHMVAPFVKESNVGAVAGNVRVLNREKGFLPRMLDVAFVYSFDFVRASQSVVNTVMCTPGALSAYRRDVVMKVLHEWLNQRYCGRPAAIGEDRAMTNLILREGCSVLFQQNAIVYTEIPVTYTKLCKMYLRWGRSNVRETIAMSRFAFKKFRQGSMLGARINLLSGWVSLVRAPLVMIIGGGILPLDVLAFGVSIISGTLIFQSLAAGMYAWKYNSYSALWSYVYGFYCFIALFWIKPYALVTSHKSGWLTRDIAPKKASNPKQSRSMAGSMHRKKLTESVV